MSHLRTMAFCLVAVFTMAAGAATSAAAAEGPQYQVCVKATKVGKKYTGQFTEKACATKSATDEGKYTIEPWNPNEKIVLDSSSGPTVFFSGHFFIVPELYGLVECKSDKDVGTYTRRELELFGDGWLWRFYGCHLLANPNNPSTARCSSPGAKPGEIVTSEMFTSLVFLDKARTKVGLLAVPEKGEVIDEFTCGSASFITRGETLSEVGDDVNKASKEETDTLAVGAENRQQYSQIEEEGPALGMTIEPLGLTAEEEGMEPGPAPASETSVDVVKSKEARYIGAP